MVHLFPLIYIGETLHVLVFKGHNTNPEREKSKTTRNPQIQHTGWTSFQSKLYYISTEKKNWTESREDCIKRGADLVIINSKEEQTFVEALNKNRGNYIGLSDCDKEGNFKWVDGTKLNTS
ncbi:C-type lectin domain family 4 member C-like [Tachysurus fulvidraco]|uniref:C-type lectin domain family 4 member C-like n=1 Tax=Tachysurus fulvidraco TaxID=1234273 RepID=UPI001FEDACA2|nr:C-type lectin domain family 4 member C-like [Tachysurus fulvidraco]